MESTRYTDIFDYIKAQEVAFKLPIRLNESWEWNFVEHVKLSTLYKNTQFERGNSKQERDNKPFKNIVRPILNLQYRAEGFDVKDIEIFVNDSKKYFKSFLVRKFHEKWARENAIDTFIDAMVESYVDFGGALIKNVKGIRPEVVPLQNIAFCDQTDILSGPIGIKHFFSPDQLLAMADSGWGETKNGATVSLKEAIALSRSEKKDPQNQEVTTTTGKYIEVYEVHGQFPKAFLKGHDTDTYSNQLHIVCFYQKDGKKNGLTLWKGPEDKLPFKFIKRDPVHGRALGFGGAEELFEAQVWTNYSEIQKKNMLDAASKTIFKTTDDAFANRNKIRDMDNLEIAVLAEGKDIEQLDTTPKSFQFFDKMVNEWEAHAQMMGAANDSIMGESPTAGTPFKLQELVTAESHSLHEYRRGKIATFFEEIYREWSLPYFVREVSKGQSFLAQLSLDELQTVADAVVQCASYNYIKERILNGELIDEAELEELKITSRDDFMRIGEKRFIEIFEGEMKGAEMDLYVNIAGKQKNIPQMVDKLVNVFRQVVAAPQVLDDPRMAKLFNEILEHSGLSPINFYQKPRPEMQQPAEPTLEAPKPAAQAAAIPRAVATY